MAECACEIGSADAGGASQLRATKTASLTLLASNTIILATARRTHRCHLLSCHQRDTCIVSNSESHHTNDMSKSVCVICFTIIALGGSCTSSKPPRLQQYCGYFPSLQCFPTQAECVARGKQPNCFERFSNELSASSKARQQERKRAQAQRAQMRLEEGVPEKNIVYCGYFPSLSCFRKRAACLDVAQKKKCTQCCFEADCRRIDEYSEYKGKRERIGNACVRFAN